MKVCVHAHYVTEYVCVCGFGTCIGSLKTKVWTMLLFFLLT